jgi:hypothetical protein
LVQKLRQLLATKQAPESTDESPKKLNSGGFCGLPNGSEATEKTLNLPFLFFSGVVCLRLLFFSGVVCLSRLHRVRRRRLHRVRRKPIIGPSLVRFVYGLHANAGRIKQWFRYLFGQLKIAGKLNVSLVGASTDPTLVFNVSH